MCVFMCVFMFVDVHTEYVIHLSFVCVRACMRVIIYLRFVCIIGLILNELFNS